MKLKQIMQEISQKNKIDSKKIENGWRKLDNRQLGEALIRATQAIAVLNFSDSTDKESWDVVCDDMTARIDALCNVADGRSSSDQIAKRMEYAPAKGLDFRGHEDLRYAEQRLMEICSGWWPDSGYNVYNESISRITQWRDANASKEGMVEILPYENLSHYPRNLSPKAAAGFLPYPGEKDTIVHDYYGRTQKEVDMENIAARKRMAELEVR